MQGYVLNVVERHVGSTLWEDHVAGATELVVTDASSFSEEGGDTVMFVASEETDASDDPTIYTVLARVDGEGEDEPDTLTITPALALDAETGATVAILPLATEKVAQVWVSEEDSPWVRVPYGMAAQLPEGIREEGSEESVEVELNADDMYSITELVGRTPVLEMEYADEMPELDLAPTEPPEESPAINVTATHDGFVLSAEDIAQTSVLDIYVNDVLHPDFTGTRATTLLLSTQPDGTLFQHGVDYTFHVVARNVVDAAPPSSAIISQLVPHNEEVTAEMILAKLNAAIAEFGTIVIGDITIDANDGIRIPQSTGSETHFPSDGSSSTFGGDAEVDSLNVKGNLTIRGTTNELAKGATLEATAGVGPPKVKPSAVARLKETGTHEGFNGRSLAYHATRDCWYQTESVADAVLVTLSGPTAPEGEFKFGWDNFALKDEGGRNEVTSGLGGVAMIGNDAYLLCQTNTGSPGTYNARWYVYQYTWMGWTPEVGSSWSFVRRWLYEPGTNLGGYSTHYPHIASDGNYIYIVQAAKANRLHVTRYTSSGGSETVTAFTDGGTNWHADRHCHGVYVGQADIGATRIWFTLDGVSTVYCVTTAGARDTANEFPGATSAGRGLAWKTEGRFIQRSASKVYTFSKQKTALTVSVANTWRKADATGPDFAAAETTISPTATVSLGARRWLEMEAGAAIPNEGGSPDSTSFYVSSTASGGSMVRAATPEVPQTAALLDTIPSSGGAPPGTTYGFAAGTSAIHSDEALGDALGPLWRLEGDNSGRIGNHRWDSTGQSIPFDSWHEPGSAGEPALTNGFTQPASEKCAFRKNAFNELQITGKLAKGTDNTSAFTLPVGYRPSRTFRYNQWSSAGFAAVSIVVGTSGTVNINWNTTTGTEVFLHSPPIPLD